MSSNRTSIPDNMNTAHRQRPDEPDKLQQQQQQNAQVNETNNKQSSKSQHSSHEECDIIGEIIGKYGKYQFFMTFLLSLFQVPNTFHISSTIYQVSLPAHRIFNLAKYHPSTYHRHHVKYTKSNLWIAASHTSFFSFHSLFRSHTLMNILTSSHWHICGLSFVKKYDNCFE